ncbi:hypothetical protein CHS0354_021410, partial [Potamilus streckersoni]
RGLSTTPQAPSHTHTEHPDVLASMRTNHTVSFERKWTVQDTNTLLSTNFIPFTHKQAQRNVQSRRSPAFCTTNNSTSDRQKGIAYTAPPAVYTPHKNSNLHFGNRGHRTWLHGPLDGDQNPQPKQN